MHHTLVRKQYPDLAAAAERLSLDEALDGFLQVYLPQAVYANPTMLARDLKITTAVLYTTFERLVAMGKVVPMPLTKNSSGYMWYEPATTITKNEKGNPHDGAA